MLPRKLTRNVGNMQALKRELNFMESEALRFAAALENASNLNCDPTQLTSQLEGRFRFLWGIYRAHSEVGKQRQRFGEFRALSWLRDMSSAGELCFFF